jgi:hypothetical protein
MRFITTLKKHDFRANLDKMREQTTLTDDDREHSYDAYDITNLQKYNPIYSVIGHSPNVEPSMDDIYGLDNRYECIDLQLVKDMYNNTNVEKDVFVKFAPLISPLSYLIGKHNSEAYLQLPKPGVLSNDITTLNCIHNASYVDSFFSYLSGQLLHKCGFMHGLEYYGSYLGIQDKYKMNIVDDYEYLSHSSYFVSNNNKLYTITQEVDNIFYNQGSRANRNKIVISNDSSYQGMNDIHLDIEILDVETMDTLMDKEVTVDTLVTPTQVLAEGEELVYENTNTRSVSSNSDGSVSDSGDMDSESDDEYDESSDSDDDDKSGSEDESRGTDGKDGGGDSGSSDSNVDEDEDDASDYETVSTESEEQEMNIYIKQFPVQMICLEKCRGTLDELFDNGLIDEEEGVCAMFQIAMILLVYQSMFHFTHNDLHTNNIMYVDTDIEYLCYEFGNKKWKIPTYGKIFKIIDFGRAIYKYNGKVYCSDNFAHNGEAGGQYNTEPFFNSNRPRLDPNYSFDLCRLGCSIYDFIIDDDTDYNKMDSLQKLIYSWCMDDNYKNVLYKKNGEERYKNFRLYKMIARTVHNHTPVSVIHNDVFEKYTIIKSAWDDMDHPLIIDNLPCLIGELSLK